MSGQKAHSANAKTALGSLALLALLVLATLVWAGSQDLALKNKKALPASEAGIKAEIETARYCSSKSDCIQVPSGCPFDCHVFVNRAEAQRISDMLNSYKSDCAYSCIQLKDFDCRNGKCTAIIQ